MLNSEKNSKNKRRRIGYNFCYDFVKVTGALPTLLLLRPKIHNPYKTKIPKGAVLISSNHNSFIDPIIVLAAFPSRRIHSLATKDLFNSKFKNAFFQKMHCIKVDKDNFSISAFHDVVSRLQDDHVVMIFPEGEVNTKNSNELLAFKSGAVMMAYKAGAPILPIYLPKREKWYQRQHIVVGNLFNIGDIVGKIPTMQKLTEASDALRATELSLREYFESLTLNKKQKNKSKISREESEKNESKV